MHCKTENRETRRKGSIIPARRCQFVMVIVAKVDLQGIGMSSISSAQDPKAVICIRYLITTRVKERILSLTGILQKIA